MTDERMALAGCLRRSDHDLLREMIGFVAQRLMDLMWRLVGAGHGERLRSRELRNGYRSGLHTRSGTIALRIPKLRRGSDFASCSLVCRRRRRCGGDPGSVRAGISTRSVHDLVKAMDDRISKSQVSRLCEEIDERVNAFLERPLEGDCRTCGSTPPTSRFARRTDRIGSRNNRGAVNAEGRREVLGMATGPSEAETFWTQFLRSLMLRGCAGEAGDLGCPRGLKPAAAKVLKASWQRCRCISCVTRCLRQQGQRQMVFALINTIFAQETAEAAHAQSRVVTDQLQAKFPKLRR